jgi:hypothetical protein
MRLRTKEEGRYFKAWVRYIAGLRSDAPWENRHDVAPHRKAEIREEADLIRSALTRKDAR